MAKPAKMTSTEKNSVSGLNQLDRERASMMQEHAAAIAREKYEEWYYGCGMTARECRKLGQRIAVWNMEKQHLDEQKRYDGTVRKDGTIDYYSVPTDDEHIMSKKEVRAADPYIFRIQDGYHKIYTDYIEERIESGTLGFA